MIDNTLMVIDFETDSTDPYTCGICQLAAIAINPLSLEIIEDSKFYVNIKPDNIDEPDYISNHRSTLEWHCRIKNITMNQLLDSWRKSTSEKVAWNNFIEYTRKYHKKTKIKNLFSAPCPIAFNGYTFDFIIIEQLSKKYGNVGKDGRSNIFYWRDAQDLMKICSLWFEGLEEGPASFSMDNIREFLGISTDNAHDAMKDVLDETHMFQKFMRLHRRLGKTIKFKGSCL